MGGVSVDSTNFPVTTTLLLSGVVCVCVAAPQLASGALTGR